ncbi:MAG: hypothetical protein JWQ25_2583, partial [Daejeonella sp.]|nr:hypothetical protein [Daejeonella sp.]
NYRFLDLASTEGGKILQVNGYGMGVGFDPPAFNTADKLYVNGNVGIGTITPENSEGWDRVLDVLGNSHSKIVASTSQVTTGIWSHNSGIYGAPAGGVIGTATNHPFSIITNKIAKVTITSSGKVGIGTTNPSTKLHIVDNENANWTATISNTSIGGHIIYAGYNNGTIRYGLNITGGGNNADTKDLLVGTDKLIVRGDGKVSIGTAIPDANALLTVKGNIISRELKVSATAGADFVFDVNYNLPSLGSIEKYVKEKKHLPEIASADEMVKEGINLGELNIKLLQKIEELTLHLIEQNKRLDAQDKRNEELQEQMNTLKTNNK